MNDLLEKIDKELLLSAIDMSNPIIDQDLGVMIYFATRYKSTGNAVYKETSLKLFNTLLSVFNDFDYETGIITGFEGAYWAIDYLGKCNIIEDSDLILKSIEENLYQSIDIDIKNNMHDLYYGSIGKIQVFLKEDKIKDPKIISVINETIKSLWDSKKEINHQYYWPNKDYAEHLGYVDLGVAHGICAILLFLVRLKELGFSNDHIDPLINGIITTLKNAENKANLLILYPENYNIFDQNLTIANSRLGFCNGDLPIAYAICYAGYILKNKEWITTAQRILEISAKREISDSGLRQFPKYDFFDIGFCHGISSILFIYYRLNKWLDSKIIDIRVTYWKEELVKNVNKLLEIQKPIYYSKMYSYNDDTIKLNKNCFLEGLNGAALVLMTNEYDEMEWSSFLNLY